MNKPVKRTMKQKLLLSLLKHRAGASWRRLYGWHNKSNYGSIYQTLHKLKKQGLVLENKGIFTITKAGIGEVSNV